MTRFQPNLESILQLGDELKQLDPLVEAAQLWEAQAQQAREIEERERQKGNKVTVTHSQLQGIIMEVRRNARLHRIGQFSDIDPDLLAFLVPFCDRLEELMKAAKGPAKAVAKKKDSPVASSAASAPVQAGSGRWLERYKSGQYEEVWQEMLDLGDAVRQEPHLTAATAVADETMRRVKINVDLLHSRLRAMGVKFRFKPLTPPPSDVASELSKIEAKIGAMPLSLQAWLRQIGGVNFIERFEIEDDDKDDEDFYEPSSVQDLVETPDPLVVEVLEYIWKDFDAYESSYDEPDGPFGINISPDEDTKSGAAGGYPGYVIKVPNGAADAPLEGERHKTTFVNYLRISFAWGGFPGVKFKYPEPPELLKKLSEGMQPF